MTNGVPCNLLVLDDEPLILLDLEYAAEDAGCVAFTAMDAEEALTIIDCNSVDAAILDVSLGRGCTCAPVVEALVERGIPYVLHTGDPNRLDEFVRSLGGELVSKPTPAAQVVERALARADGYIHVKPAIG
jgi:DNA-binding response OmpR family regulator